MSESAQRLKLKDVRSIFHLIGELRQMGADPNVWRPHMVQRLLELFDAQIVVSSEVHFRKLGRGAMRLVDVGWGVDELGNKWQIHTERDDERPENYWLAAKHPTAEEGDKTNGGDSVIPVIPAKKTHTGTSFILSQFPLPHVGAVDQLGVHRAFGEPLFTPVQHKLVRLLHVELGRLWRRDVLRKAQDPTTDLPPRLQQTLAELMLGRSEKEIANKLQLSKHTIHNYVKALHQRLGVSSRGELLAMAGNARADFIPRLSVEGPRNP